MRRLVASGIVFVVVVAATSAAWFALQRGLPASEWPERVVELEQTLALPGLLGLAAVDVGAAVRLQDLAGVDAAPDAVDESSWPARLERVGVDWRSDVDHLLAGVYARDEGVGFALAAFGSFAPAELERDLRASPDFEVETALLQEREVLELHVRDRATCELSGPWLLHVGAERLIVADPDTLAALLSTAPRSAPAARELESFRSFRSGRLASVGLFRPEAELAIANPMLGMALATAASQLDGFQSLHLGAAVHWMPPSLELATVLGASDASGAEAMAQRWKLALSNSRERLGAELPTARALIDELQISTEGDELWLRANVDRSVAARLGQLPQELVATAFGGPALAALAMGGGEAPAEQLAEKVRRFEPVHAVESIAPYDATVPFAGGVDAESGPFGFRLLSLALPNDPARGVEIAIEAVGTGLANLPADGERVQLQITSVRGRTGAELLARETCGAERNDLPVALSALGDSAPLTGTKRIRLVRGASPDDIAFIEGHVKLVYPTRTETLRVAADAGTSVERNGARLAVTDVRGGSVVWKLEGRDSGLLELRALNASGQALMQQSSMQMGSMFGASSGRSGSTDFAGAVEQVEAIFATEDEAWEFPFALEQMRPGTAREQTGGPTQEFVSFPIERIRREFGDATRDLIAQDGPPAAAETHTGPFVVALESMWSFRGLTPRFEVRSPAIPNLEQSLGALELRLREIRLKDGTIQLPDTEAAGWSQTLALGEAWGSPGLRADAALETRAQVAGSDVASLSGELVLRMPKRVFSLSLDDVSLGAELQAPGFSAVVSELGRDRFALRSRRGGERLLAVRAYNAAGELLWMTGAQRARDADGWHSEFGVQGVPARLEAVVASELETAEYPFSMQLAAN